MIQVPSTISPHYNTMCNRPPKNLRPRMVGSLKHEHGQHSLCSIVHINSYLDVVNHQLIYLPSRNPSHEFGCQPLRMYLYGTKAQIIYSIIRARRSSFLINHHTTIPLGQPHRCLLPQQLKSHIFSVFSPHIAFALRLTCRTNIFLIFF